MCAGEGVSGSWPRKLNALCSGYGSALAVLLTGRCGRSGIDSVLSLQATAGPQAITLKTGSNPGALLKPLSALLVALGFHLDDKIATTIYQRRRDGAGDGDWLANPDAPTVAFGWPSDVGRSAGDGG